MSGDFYLGLILFHVILFSNERFRNWFFKSFVPAMGQLASQAQTTASKGTLLGWIGGIAYVGLIIWAFATHKTPNEVGTWSSIYWIAAILTLVGIKVLFGVEASPARKWGANVITTVLAIILVGSGLYHYHQTNPGEKTVTSSAVGRAACPNASRYKTQQCELGQQPSQPFGFGDGVEDNGMQLCASNGVILVRKFDQDGTTFWVVKGPYDGYVMRYRIVPAGAPCPTL